MVTVKDSSQRYSSYCFKFPSLFLWNIRLWNKTAGAGIPETLPQDEVGRLSNSTLPFTISVTGGMPLIDELHTRQNGSQRTQHE